jgi:hypothetical protein
VGAGNWANSAEILTASEVWAKANVPASIVSAGTPQNVSVMVLKFATGK